MKPSWRLGLLILPMSLLACGERRSLEVREPVFQIESRSEAQARDPFRGNADYLANTCSGTWDGGDAAWTKTPEQPELVAFQKPFDRSRLSAVLSLSPRATLAFVESDGADVFAAPLRAGPCALFAPIPEVPDSLWEIWSPASSGVGRTLLGLFLPLARVRADGFLHPVIVVRADADRYTLVHEFMHFVFDRARNDDADVLALTQSRLARLKSLLPYSAADEKNAARMGDVADAWSEAAESIVALLDQFPLEEMTVESLLREAYRTGALINVSSYSRKNGDAYILSNWSKAKPLLDGIAADVIEVRRIMSALEQNQRLSRLSAIESKVRSRLTEGQSMADRAEPLRPANLMRARDGLHEPGACSRDLDLTKFKIPRLR